MKKLLFYTIAVLLFTFCVPSYAQHSHAGVLLNSQFEGAGSGNGTIVGTELQANLNFRLGSQELAFINNLQLTRDTKTYLNQAGWTQRNQARLRYFVPRANGAFIQAGAYFGHTSYPDGELLGYTKRIVQPVVGAGYRYHDKTGVITINGNYLYQLPGTLWATRTDRPIAYRDGRTWGQRIGVETSVRIKQSRWLGLFNLSHGWSTYQRDAAFYGAEAAAIKHRFTVTEISFGVAYQWGAK